MHVIWAKTSPEGTYHPLLLHLLDVAAVAEAIWERVLTARARELAARSLALDVADAGRWLVLLAALHDIGKCSPAFQRKSSDRLAELDAHGMAPSGVARSEDIPHGTISAFDLEQRLGDWGCDRRVATALAIAVGGHHGAFPKRLRGAGARSQGGDGRWSALRDAHAATVDGVIGRPERAPQRHDALALTTLAGLTSVADWIGSDAERFPFQRGPLPEPHAYHAKALVWAHQAIDELRWADRGLPRLVTWAARFEEAFPQFHAGPRGAQRATVELVPEDGRPYLLLVESETGSGKTEAAFWSVQRALRAGATGAYVALPTQATANQMHERFVRFLREGLGVRASDVGLLHGSAALAVDEEALQSDPPAVEPSAVYDAEPGSAGPVVDARSWFQQRKRGLLAPFAVGTIDQALLGVLLRRHFFVRLWGLSGAAVVLDEVHAYDAYTSELLAQLVRWLGACGSSVVLLSATLAPHHRRELIEAYRGGAGWPALAEPEPPPAYPRVTLAHERGVESRPVESVRPADRRDIMLRWDSSAADADGLAARVLAAVEQGGCAAVVCNTVELAQRRFTALRDAAGFDVRVELLHARMRHCERAAVEDGLLGRYGPGSDARPERAVVVATQVVEQSLDVDFDVMWSDLAPIDLLVQRAGRIMRHDRVRPLAHERRALHVLVADRDEPTVQVPASKVVYGEAALLRTRLVLARRAAIREPDDLDELIAAVYGEGQPPCEPRVAALLAKALADAEQHRRKLSTEGQLAALADPRDPELLNRLCADDTPDAERDEGRLGTRWDDRPSVRLVVLRDGELVRERRAPATPDDVRALLRRSLSLSVAHPRAAHLRAELPRAEWKGRGPLSHHVLVELDCQDRGFLDDLSVEWDETLGLILPSKEGT